MASPAINQMLSLAASIHFDRGVYVPLIGSGMSTSAGIKTGWDFTKELAELEAKKKSGQVPEDIEAWWRDNKEDIPLEYSTLIESMAPSLGQRQALLRSIIEPTPDELTIGLKVPTPAHRALADLVMDEYVNVIITTNFDRLIETALHEVGIQEQMLSGSEDLNGMIPLQHTACTVIKVHGDYQQANLRNTEAELSEYDPEWLSLIRRVLAEYGLFTVGWSGASDRALRNEIEMAAGKRYGYFLGIHGTPAEEIRPLLEERKATLVSVTNANEFFDELTGTLKEIAHRPTRPLKTAAIVGTTKRLLSQGRTKIELREILLREAHLIKAEIDRFSLPNSADYLPELDKMVERVQPLAGALATGCYYGERDQHHLWGDVFRLISDQPPPMSGWMWDQGLGLRRLPGMIALYTASLAASAAQDFAMMGTLLRKTLRHSISTDVGEPLHFADCPVYIALAPPEVLDRNALGWGAGNDIRLSNIVFEAVQPVLVDQFPVSRDLADAFEDFEYVMALLQYEWHLERELPAHPRWEMGTFHRGLIASPGGYAGPPRPSAIDRFNQFNATLAGHLLGEGFFEGNGEVLRLLHEAVSSQLGNA